MLGPQVFLDNIPPVFNAVFVVTVGNVVKGLDGITTHDTFEEVPVFANAQDMQELAGRIRARLAAADWRHPTRPPFHGFLLSRHGLYTWGRDLAEARRHIEIYEFLFECAARSRMLPALSAYQQQAAQQQ
jgi:methylthioribulose-1-phosphate dehydratase